MADSEEERERARAASRRYQEKNAERIAERKRRYRQQNAEKIAEYKRQWRERNLEHDRARNRDLARRKAQETRDEQAQRARKAQYARDRYHADIESSRAKAREYRQAARQRDPDAYRASRKRANDAWRAKHKDEINARSRERNQLDPEAKRARARRHYERHADQIRAARRRYYQEHREQQLAKQRLWRERERRRTTIGLPVRRLHRVTPEERRENARAADAFFARPLTPELRERLDAEVRTPPELLESWHRECARIRAANYALRHPETSARVVNRRQAEEERLDAIARVINDRLRTSPRAWQDPAAYAPPAPAPSPKGLGL